MTLQEIVRLLRAGAAGCRSASDEMWGDMVDKVLGDAEDLDDLANQLEGGAHLWVEDENELTHRITEDR